MNGEGHVDDQMKTVLRDEKEEHFDRRKSKSQLTLTSHAKMKVRWRVPAVAVVAEGD